MVWPGVLLGFCVLSVDSTRTGGNRPNIVYVLADDVGWADVSWNNPRLR